MKEQNMTSNFIIYALRDPNSKEIRYIGKSTSGLKRPNEHSKPYKLNENNHKAHWVKSLVDNGQYPEIETLISTEKVEELAELEIKYIKMYKEAGSPLTNLTEGGEGALGRIVSKETREKMSKKRSAYAKGKPTPEGMTKRKEHIFQEGIECKECTDCKEILSLDNYNKHDKYWDKLNRICKECQKIRFAEYRKDNPTKTLSEEEWCQSYIDRSKNISKGVQKRFDDDPEYSKKISKARSKKIKAFNPITKETLFFDSALKAKESGFQNSNIGQAIRSKLPYRGFLWSFASENSKK